MSVRQINARIFGLNPLMFLPDDGGAGGGDGGAGGGTGGQQGGNPPGQTGQQQGDPGRTFTQADVDRIAAEARRTARPADYDQLKAQAAKLAEIEAANASEQDKAIKKATDEATAATTARFTTERVLDKAEVLAAKTWADPHDARLRLADRARAGEFLKDGQPDETALETALKAELAKSPHLLSTPPDPRRRPGPDRGQGQGGSGNPSRSQAGMDEAVRRGFVKPQT